MIQAPSLLIVITSVLASINTTAVDEPATKFLRSWAAAWQASDVEKMLAFYDSGDETLTIESLGRVRKGQAQIRKMYQVAFDELEFERVTLTPITQGNLDSVAWATCRYKADMRLKSDKTRLVLEVLGTFVMKRNGGVWKITLEHFSTIPGVPRIREAGD